MSAEPAVFGNQVTRTMFAALYGELMPHQRLHGLDHMSQDAYSLFYARSAAMGWLTPAAGGGQGGLWGMNDAEAAFGSRTQPSRAAFFQVALTGPPQGGLLPVQPFLACADDVLQRLGTLRLDAVQVLLPERGADADGRLASPSGLRTARSLLDALNWFADREPGARTPVRVTLDGGSDPLTRAAAPGIVPWVREIEQDVFACDSFSLADDDHVALLPTTFDEGSDHSQVTLAGTLAEWSLDAVGWLAAFLADVISRHGVSTPLMFAVDRWPAGSR